MKAVHTLATPLDMFYHWEKTTPQRVFLRQPVDGLWQELRWSDVAFQVRRIAQVLKDLGCQPGDRVAILSKNCAHWIMADLAIFLSGCVSVPLYPNQSADTLRYVLEHSETKAIFVGKLDQPEALDKGIPEGIHRIRFPYPNAMTADLAWGDLLQKGALWAESPRRNREELASIIYTSGTTGHPKGVMHTFASMAAAAQSFTVAYQFSDKDRLFSYLPLSHVAERILIEMNGLFANATISFAESQESFVSQLQSVQPTLFFSVPRLWTKFQQGVLSKMSQEKLDRLLSIPLLSQLVQRKLRYGLGLGKARVIGSGAAPIAPSLLTWYQKLGIEITEGYGLTETFGLATGSQPGQTQFGTVGKPMPGCKITCDSQGQILIRNGALMKGYYKDPEATAAILKDGALQTGDIGRLDARGYLHITGRIKEIFKTDKGKYVAPGPIEHKLLAHNPHIEQLIITGHSLPHPVALCVLTERARQQPREQIQKAFAESLEELNRLLDSHERVNHCVLVSEDWTIEGGLMTPTLKIKRHTVEKKYQEKLSRIVESKDLVIWDS